ncbi:metallophosphoesterase [Paenibacillus sp. GCM10023252]|uniref:metallophosphoesterase n=1 Tax=Paenibacillus sp. GCM10023252 TaxID=3252649 RepID=UPI003620E3A9
MRPRMIAGLAVILTIYSLIVWYIGWNGWVYARTLFGWSHLPVYTSLVIVIGLSYILGRIGQNKPIVRPAAQLLKLIGSYWFAVIQYSVLVLPAADLAAWMLKLAGAPKSMYIGLIGTIVLALLSALLIRGSWNAWNPIVRTYRVTIPKGAGEPKSLRIGAASDLHLGTIVGNRHLRKLVSEMERMQPDLILLPGDVIDDDIRPFIHRRMGEVIGELKAPLGVYAVLGNHEYIGGHIAEYTAEMDAAGIRVLQDEHVLIDDSFYLIGRKDRAAQGFRAGGRLSIAELLEEVPHKELPLVMMDHQPSDLTAAANLGIDLTLSGHTHRGQMMPNHLITRRIFEVDWGYLRKGNLHAIVSSGFGTWGPPIRIGSRSEIVEIIVDFTG